jgi:hypothetical protein
MAKSTDGYSVNRLYDAHKYPDSDDNDWSSHFFLRRGSWPKSR